MSKKIKDTFLQNGCTLVTGEIVYDEDNYYLRRSVRDYKINLELSVITAEQFDLFLCEPFEFPTIVHLEVKYHREEGREEELIVFNIH